MKMLLLLLATALAGCAVSNVEGYSAVTVRNPELGEFTFFVEVAQTPEDFREGLMFRESLDDDKGMLFPYKDSAQRSFWMKNTLIPLDIIFIDENLIIKRIHNAVPCRENPCQPYVSGVPVKYALEIRGNLTTEKNIKEGNVVELKLNEKR